MKTTALTKAQQEEAARTFVRAIYLASLPESVREALKIVERVEANGGVAVQRRPVDRAA
jgi:uncharacterized protein YnzC (UPF0291/DUF896 family)